MAATLATLLVLGSPVGAQETDPGTDPDGSTATPVGGTDEPVGGDVDGSQPVLGPDVSDDSDAPLVDPVDQSLVDQVLEATARLAELDTAIVVTLGQIAEADQQIVELNAQSADIRDSIETTEDGIADREDDIAETREHIADLEDLLRARVVDAYINGGSSATTFFGVTDIDEIDRLATRRAISESHARADAEVAAELRTTRRQLDRQRDQLEAQVERLDQRESDVAALQTEVSRVRTERADLLTSLSESRDEQAEVAIEAQDSLGVAMDFVQAQLDALERIGIDGTSGLPPAGFALDGQPLCDAAGIIVACRIARNITFMIAAAQEDGVTLTGGGWRSTAEQIALRIAHCGGDIYTAPASSCSPPTARPGSSQHEFGLAIDFANCSSRSTPCYQWLAEYGEAYGLFNLPSEPWHWSTTGN